MAYRVRVKICGVTTPEQARTAAKFGADAIGLNFYPRSPRYITGAQATEILEAIPPFVEPVGLFVNQSFADVDRMARRLGIRTVQLHGDQAELPTQSLLRVIPAFGISVEDESTLTRLNSYLERLRTQERTGITAILIDAHVPGMYGGTGKTAPWQLLNDLLRDWVRVNDFIDCLPIILAGGLTPDNVAEAICIVRPYAVDVASGVESAPGRKDPDKLRRFIENARAAAI